MREYPWSKTFPPIENGIPSGKIIVPAVTDIPPQKITPENYFFMTGTMPNFKHIHTDKCADKCVERCNGCKDCDCGK